MTVKCFSRTAQCRIESVNVHFWMQIHKFFSQMWTQLISTIYCAHLKCFSLFEGNFICTAEMYYYPQVDHYICNRTHFLCLFLCDAERSRVQSIWDWHRCASRWLFISWFFFIFSWQPVFNDVYSISLNEWARSPSCMNRLKLFLMFTFVVFHQICL